MKLTIGAVILAAGLARRMGEAKQFLSLDGNPLFLHSVDLAIRAKLDPIILVVGNNKQQYEKYLSSYPNVIVLENKQYQEGMGTSLRLGVSQLDCKVEGVFILLADQPFVDVTVIQNMANKFKADGSRSIVRPVYSAMEGHPILFPSSLFPEFANLEGDTGGKSLIKKHWDKVSKLDFNQTDWGFDIDTPDDYVKAQEMVKNK
ncbi:nucleotidyltransferase family protein [Peribacillus saganii]|uniref:Nucleotidyltransferase family protein n=1 Tax=Peribacillus saganii TaxID=2303992 RepID=A0A372LSG8_9BACI|nr:nucleotidyltransferase family protein [Peribacillus saganii]RFU70494.1 nucleotidyltransferase family protein [Peribacillus saganii]